jgi:hypothetical protein
VSSYKVALNPHQLSDLKQADRSAVVNALSGLALNRANIWLPSTHVAVNGIERSIHRTDGNGTSPILGSELAEYLAVATPTHCADGWSYLSRALNSYFLGDAHSAWHFAYYAELRAAQSILSASGCGAFDGWNCVLDSSGNILNVGKEPTHKIVWQALAGLVEVTAPASSHIAAATLCFGHSLPDVVQYAYSGRSGVMTSSNWINEWMFDLQASSADKGFRNRCSYSPHVFTPHRADVIEAIEIATSLWQSLEPMPGATFLELDKQLIRAALEKAARESIRLNGKVENNQTVIEEMQLAYRRVIAAAPTFQIVPESFITRIDANVHPILLHARNDNPNPDSPRPVIARAILLLRMATGVTQNLIKDAGQVNQFAFWLDELAERHGIVSNRSAIPADRSELHLDCAVAAEDLETRVLIGGGNLASLLSHHDVKPHLFSQLERVVQWSFAT